MSNITDRDIFNKVKEALIRQGDKCVDFHGEEPAYTGWKQKEIQGLWDLLKLDYDYMDSWEVYETITNEASKRKIYEVNCAIGHIVDFTIDSWDIEEQSIDSEYVLEAVEKSNPDWKMDVDSVAMLHFLQSLHDALPVSKWVGTFALFENAFTNEGKWNCKIPFVNRSKIEQDISDYAESLL